MANCTITGTLLDALGEPLADAEIYVIKALKDGVFIQAHQLLAATSDDDGLVTFTVPRASTVWIYGNFHTPDQDFTIAAGVMVGIPDSATATLESLAAVPTEGMSVWSNSVPIQNLITTLNFSNDFTVTEDPDGTVLIENASALSVTDEQVQDALATFFPDSGAYDWTYDDAGNRVSLVIAVATTSVNGLMSAADKVILDAVPTTYQPLDADLTAIAGLTPTNDDLIQRKAGAWTNRTIAQVKTDLVLVKADVGLGNAENVSDLNKPISTATQTALDLKADLVGGFVPSGQLPSFVDDVIEAANFAALPGTGATGKIYVTLDNNLTYRWSGSAYVQISESLALGETISTAYRGDRGATAYNHSQATGNPHGATTADVADSLNKRYVTDANLTTIGNQSGVNTGDQSLAGLALDADVVHDTGAETIAGVKTFSSDPIIPDEVYGVGWNGSLEPPTKNAVYDKIETLAPGSSNFGYLNIPQNSQSAAYTTVLSDSGKHILHPVADNNARTFTIDSNANVAYPVGTAITFVNEINTVTISITSDTLTLAGAGTTGSRTLAANGIATAIKITATKWVISGTGLT